MLTLSERIRKLILQVVLLLLLIALAVLYVTKNWLFTNFNTKWKDVRPIDSRAANSTYHGTDLMKLVGT